MAGVRYEDVVVVAIDGQEPDRFVLRWAAEEAADRGVALSVCHLWEWSSVDRAPQPLLEMSAGDVRSAPERVVDDAVGAVRAEFPDLPVSRTLGYGRPAPALLALSDRAGMIVVGTRGTGGFAGLQLGSVSAQVAAHARCPVAVVRKPASGTAADVVVGVDGSAQSDHALRLGLAEARRFGGTLVAVHGYRLPPLPAAYAPNPGVDEKAHRASAESVLDQALADVEAATPEMKIERRIAAGPPARALLEASAAGAAALVVGSRGLGGFAGLVLGSVSQQVVRHAPCPVIVAHGR